MTCKTLVTFAPLSVYSLPFALSSTRDGIFKLLRSPGIDSASLCSLAGRYDNPIPTQFLASIDCSKIPAQHTAAVGDNYTICRWCEPRGSQVCP
jgi:hypothetical protein